MSAWAVLTISAPWSTLASRGGVLTESELLAVSGTLISSRSLARNFEKVIRDYPHLAEIVRLFPPPPGIIEAISRCISDRAEVLDNASQKLASIRAEIKVSHARLLSKLERMLGDPHTAPMLQESIITQRNGRYVIPLRAEFKSKLKSIIHDQSSSGATLVCGTDSRGGVEQPLARIAAGGTRRDAPHPG